jgi:DNA-binding PadR family transcriptional regulator
MLEREEEAENQRSEGKEPPDDDYVYGAVFRITDSGRELLKEIWEKRGQQ